MVEMMVSVLTWLGLACWVVCLWWMHRTSSRHGTLLSDPPGTNKTFPQAQHDTIQEVHPKLSQSKENVENVAPAMTTDPKESMQ